MKTRADLLKRFTAAMVLLWVSVIGGLIYSGIKAVEIAENPAPWIWLIIVGGILLIIPITIGTVAVAISLYEELPSRN